MLRSNLNYFYSLSSNTINEVHKRIVDFLKKGGTIHIKEKNKGKFTASAKSAGESVQEHAHNVMNNPNSTALQKKRANFAIQASKWNHKKN